MIETILILLGELKEFEVDNSHRLTELWRSTHARLDLPPLLQA